MTPVIEINTPRLLLRQWQDADRQPYADLNTDPIVMEFFPKMFSREQCDSTIDYWKSQIAEQGWGNWAVETIDTREFIGFVGLSVPRRLFPFSPCVEIGWRLARPFWHKGYATEAAHAALEVGFTRMEFEEIVSFTALTNLRSRAVMERIGMINAHEDFEHAGVPEGHALRRHCLYRLPRRHWEENSANLPQSDTQ